MSASGHKVPFEDAAWKDRFSALCEASHKAEERPFAVISVNVSNGPKAAV